MTLPEHLLRRSAEAKAKATGRDVEEILAEMKGEAPPAPAAAAPQETPAAEAPAEAPAPAPVETPEEEGFEVTAPMVGTFYAASSPGAAPYVQVGDRINEGDTLCIVEAMKMMNQIESDVAGVVKSIRVQNGEPIEFGQVLFVIDQRAG